MKSPMVQKRVTIGILILVVVGLSIGGYLFVQSKQEKVTPLSDTEWQTQKKELDKVSEESEKYCQQVEGIPVADVEASEDCKYSK